MPAVGNLHAQHLIVDDGESAFYVVRQRARVVEVVGVQPNSSRSACAGGPGEVDRQRQRRPAEPLFLTVGHETEGDHLDITGWVREQRQQPAGSVSTSINQCGVAGGEPSWAQLSADQRCRSPTS